MFPSTGFLNWRHILRKATIKSVTNILKAHKVVIAHDLVK